MRFSDIARTLSACVFLLVFAIAIRAAQPTQPASQPATTSPLAGIPDVVMLDQLQKAGQDLYNGVPFAHKRHAQMAEMWDGCTTCHHHTPEPGAATQAAAATQTAGPHSQNDASKIPACRSCHPIVAENASIQMPSLKGAYHRQCLNCHRDWMDANACNVCHDTKGEKVAATMPTPDDIVGRMHPPIGAPVTRAYVARFTPVAGPNVLFRHEEHARRFSLTCVTCHRHDRCDECHHAAANAATSQAATLPIPTTGAPISSVSLVARGKIEGSHPLRPGRTWAESHGPCIACHKSAACTHCHYQDDQSPPAEFSHSHTKQPLDKDHATLACGSCHPVGKTENLTCGAASCHKRTVRWPNDRPGPMAVTAPIPTTHTAPPATTAPATGPATRPLLIRIRRGGQ